MEDGLDQPDDGRVGGSFVDRELRDVDVAGAQFLAHFERDGGDLLGAPVHDVHRAQQLGFAHQRDAQRLFESGDQFVIDEKIGGVGHADREAARIRLQHQRAEAARQRFGQQAHRGLIERELAQVDERNLQVARQRVVELLLLHDAKIGEHAAELAAGLLLLGQRLVELRLIDDLLLDEQLAQADLLAPLRLHLTASTSPFLLSAAARSVLSSTMAFSWRHPRHGSQQQHQLHGVAERSRLLLKRLPMPGTSLRNGVL